MYHHSGEMYHQPWALLDARTTSRANFVCLRPSVSLHAQPNVLFCMPNRINRILLVSVMQLVDTVCGVQGAGHRWCKDPMCGCQQRTKCPVLHAK
jgi:hypothetical protein